MAKHKKTTNAKQPKSSLHDDRVDKMLSSDYKGKVPKVSTDAPSGINTIARLDGVTTISDKMLKLTQNRAFWYLNLPPCDKERPVNEDHVQGLVDQMLLGRFNWDNVIIATGELNGVTYKLNGQHTCWAVSFMPDDYVGRIREIQYRVQSRQQLIALYQTYDSHRSTRSLAHVVRMDVSDIPQLSRLPLKVVSSLASATLFWQVESKHGRKRYSAPQRRDLVEKHIDAVSATAKFYAQARNESKDIRRMPVLAAMIATFDKVPTIATDFWKPVAYAVGITEENDPRRRLMRYLSETTLSASKHNDRRPEDPEDMFRVCINAWNKWREGKKIKTTPRATDGRVRVK